MVHHPGAEADTGQGLGHDPGVAATEGGPGAGPGAEAGPTAAVAAGATAAAGAAAGTGAAALGPSPGPEVLTKEMRKTQTECSLHLDGGA